MKYVGLFDEKEDIVTKDKLDAVEAAIPTKTSQLDNDSGFITSAPVTSVNTKTGAVTLSATDVDAQPTITVNGILKGDGAGGVSMATPGTDYLTEAPVTSVNGATGEVKGTFYVTVTQGDGNQATADKTAAEVYAAYAAGYAVYAIVEVSEVDVTFELPLVSAERMGDAVMLGFGTLGSLNPTANPQYLTVAYNGMSWMAWLGTLAKKSDIPMELKNPYSLNIKIGDKTTRYDGSAAKTVEIPEGVPSVTTADNGKILRVVNGAWAATELLSAGGA